MKPLSLSLCSVVDPSEAIAIPHTERVVIVADCNIDFTCAGNVRDESDNRESPSTEAVIPF